MKGHLKQQQTTDLITEQDTDKYFTQPDEQDNGNDTETISSTFTADYDREEVETSLATIAEAFHTIGNEYEQLCVIVPHMTKVQTASVISRLSIVPFLGKKEKVKAETKPEMDTVEPTTMAPPQLENPQVPPVTETPQVSETP